MQPTYLPWLGYLDLVDRVDVFIVLDHVQFAKRSWQQRNRIKTPEGLTWLTVPVQSKGRFDQPIDEVAIDGDAFVAKHLRTIELNYARAEHFQAHFGAFTEAFQRASAAGMLAALNLGMIAWLTQRLGMSTAFVRSSSLAPAAKRTALLVDLCRQVGADTYLSPLGSLAYLAEEHETLREANIQLRFQHFVHPTYPQLHGPFLPYASAIDALFNVGEGSVDSMRSGRRPDLSVEEALAAAAGARRA